MEMQATLTGAKFFKDTVEGTEYDSTKLYVLLGMDTSTGRAIGQASGEYQYGTSENWGKVKEMLKNGPVRVMLDVEQVTSGKNIKTIVNDVKLLAQAPAKVG